MDVRVTAVDGQPIGQKLPGCVFTLTLQFHASDLSQENHPRCDQRFLYTDVIHILTSWNAVLEIV